MARKAVITIGKICLTLLCLFIPGIITTICKDNGVILGGIPTVILYTPILGALFRIWRKPTEKEQSEGQSQKMPEVQPQEPPEENQLQRIAYSPQDIHVSKEGIIISILSIVCAICVVMLIVSSQEIKALNKGLVEQQEVVEALNAELAQKESEIAGLAKHFDDARELTEEQKEIADEVIEKYQDENISENLSVVHNIVDELRSGERTPSSFRSWNEFKDFYKTIESMFREIKNDDIQAYIHAVYNLETDLYPIEYFKNQGYTYTGDVIHGWVP